MATLKCKMCGGDLELTPDVTVAECPYCGTKQTVPNADNEKKMTLFSRANRLRFNNEFDKAAGVYETIIGEFPEEAEAYWGLVLCKYGIEYVDDPATGKKIPTCHRSSFDSVMEDENLELAMEYADAVAKRMYREEAKQIEEIRKGILEVSSKEEPYDVFICYKETDESGERTLDSVLAQDIYNELTEKGYRVFFSRITLEDKLGQEYEPYIFAALHSARVMLAVGTSYEHYDAVWVKNEWSRYLQLMAAGEKKTLIPCYKDLDAYDMPKEFAKLQAQDLGKVGAMQDLVRGVEKILGKKGEQNASAADTAASSGIAVLNAQTAALLKRGYMALEDRQFDKATEFFDQVLNNDAECGQAYFGKVFASYKVCTENAFIERLWDKLEKDERGKEVHLTVKLPELAREADTQTQMLSDFTDKELRKLMEGEFGKISLSYDDCRAYYERQFTLTDLVHNPDFKRAVRYADAELTKKINQICENLTDKLQQRIQLERLKPFIVEKKLQSKKKEIEKAVEGWLKGAEGRIEALKAEEQAVRELEYQVTVQAIETDYEKQLSDWKQVKAAYTVQYKAAVAKRSQLEEKIAQLEQEKEQLKGLFIKKRKEELSTKISLLRASLAAVALPQDPGEPPIHRNNLPNREEFHVNFMQNKNQIAAAIFPVFRKQQKALQNQKKEQFEKERQMIEKEQQKIEKEQQMFAQLDIKFQKASVGDRVSFGKYPYDKDGNEGAIEWRILDKRGNSLLMITEYGIDVKKMDEVRDRAVKFATNWENCTLRNWLNREFLNSAFSDFEKKLIQITKMPESPAGLPIQDQVFLLSNKEAFEKYFPDNKSRCCFPTQYAAKQGATCDYFTKATFWWLRTQVIPQTGMQCVLYKGNLGTLRADVNTCIRPALWVKLDPELI